LEAICLENPLCIGHKDLPRLNLRRSYRRKRYLEAICLENPLCIGHKIASGFSRRFGHKGNCSPLQPASRHLIRIARSASIGLRRGVAHEIPRRISRSGGRAPPAREINSRSRALTLMEVCGGQTHAIVRFRHRRTPVPTHFPDPRPPVCSRFGVTPRGVD